jgi:hypothetical protein
MVVTNLSGLGTATTVVAATAVATSAPTSGTDGQGVSVQYLDNAWLNRLTVYDTVMTAIYASGTKLRITDCNVRDIGKSDNVGRGGIVVADENEMTADAPVITGNRCYDDQGTKVQKYGIQIKNLSNFWTIVGNDVRDNDTAGMSLVGAGNLIDGNLGYVDRAGGVVSVADGGTISHGLATTPTRYGATTTTTGEFVSITAVSSTTLTVAIKKHDNTAGTTQNIAWWAEV